MGFVGVPLTRFCDGLSLQNSMHKIALVRNFLQVLTVGLRSGTCTQPSNSLTFAWPALRATTKLAHLFEIAWDSAVSKSLTFRASCFVIATIKLAHL